jgi:hypothetical protein
MAFSAAIAAPIGAPSDLEDDGGIVMLTKKEGGGKGGDKGAKSPKAGGGERRYHPRRRHRDNVGGAIFFGIAYCAIVAANCADQYGSGTRRYYWCVRDAGC